MEKKMFSPTELLFHGVPNEFVLYLNYCKHLKFEDKLDYSYLNNLIKDLFAKIGFVK